MNISDMFLFPSSYFTRHPCSLLALHALKSFHVTQGFLINETASDSIFCAQRAPLTSFEYFDILSDPFYECFMGGRDTTRQS